MLDVERFFRLDDKSGGLGLSCDETGLRLGGAPLLRRTDTGFEPRSAFEVEALIAGAYAGAEDGARLAGGLRVVADSLNKGDLAKAMIAAVFLRLPDLDWDGAVRIAKMESALEKYDPNEPRERRGRWTTGGVGGGMDAPTPTMAPATVAAPAPMGESSRGAHLTDAIYDGQEGGVTDVVYMGKFHDEVVAEVAELAEEHGSRVVTEVDLACVNGATTRADLIIAPRNGGPMALVEVKTGKDPPFTDGQEGLYPFIPIGGHVWPTNRRLLKLGYPQGAFLPPMVFGIVYQKDEASDLKIFGLDDVLPKWKIPKGGSKLKYGP